jgi:hypothetical protein
MYIKTWLREKLCEEDSVELPQGAILWQSCVNAVMNLQVP